MLDRATTSQDGTAALASGPATDGTTVGGKSKRQFWRLLGPGLITGASDDDPSGIATYSQVGAQYGYAMAWTMLFSYPLMVAIQEISARIGRVTGHGIAGNLRQHYPPWLLRAIVGLLLFANIINLGTDLGAMGDAVHLLIGGPRHLYVIVFAVACAWLEIFSRYERYVAILKWSALSLLTYVATVLAVHVPWGQVALRTLVPAVIWKKSYIEGIVAVLGTTISPYLFFWQSSEEAEDEQLDPDARALEMSSTQASKNFHRIDLDTCVGMGYSNLIALFIIITTAATLHATGITDIQTSAEAATALRPIAGRFASAIFALGIIGIGLLAIPVLAGSAAYAIGEAFNWPTGLNRRPGAAKAFYGTIALATLLGSAITFTSINPIKALFWTAIINGVVAVPLMVVMMVMTAQPKVMGQFTLPAALRTVGWLSAGIMTLAVVAMFWTWLA